MRRSQKTTPRWPVVAAVAAMFGLTVWLVIQMVSDAPHHGAYLIRIVVAVALVVVTLAVAGAAGFFRGPRKPSQRPH